MVAGCSPFHSSNPKSGNWETVKAKSRIWKSENREDGNQEIETLRKRNREIRKSRNREIKKNTTRKHETFLVFVFTLSHFRVVACLISRFPPPWHCHMTEIPILLWYNELPDICFYLVWKIFLANIHATHIFHFKNVIRNNKTHPNFTTHQQTTH